jgi:hypothetical protein
MMEKMRVCQVFASLLIILTPLLSQGQEVMCRDLFTDTEKSAHQLETPSWVREEFPAIYLGVSRAVGSERAAAFFKGMHRDDLRATDKKFDDFRRRIIEHMRDPSQSNTIPRLYALEIFGSLGEALALAEFRRTQAPGVSVVGDPARGSSASASRRRPDGMAFQIDEVTGKITIFSLLESKISKTSASGFKAGQYKDMLQEWKDFGLEVNGRIFTPEQIEIVVADKRIPIRQLSDEDFLSAVFLYQPSAYGMSPEQRINAGIAHLMPVLLQPWIMRYIGFSVISEALHPYMPDRFPQYQHDMQELIGFYRAAQGRLNLAHPQNEVDLAAKTVLGKYDVEQLKAAVATLAPELLQKIKGDQTIYAPKPIEVAPKKSALAAKNDFEAWQAGRLVIDDPVELIQLQIHSEPDMVFSNFLRMRGRWPGHVDLTKATEANALALIVEDRFQSSVERVGGNAGYLLLVMKKETARDFLTQTHWRPDQKTIEQFLASAGNNMSKRATYIEMLASAFGPEGWGLASGEKPIWNRQLLSDLGRTVR